MREEHSAGAVIATGMPERRFLLLKYQGGHWGHVKGHVEEGESLRETVRREAKEETGLGALSFVEGFHEEISYVFKRGADTVRKRVDFLLATTPDTDVEVAAPEEHTEVGWFSFEDAMDLVTFEDPREVLVRANARLDQTEQARLDGFD